MDLKLRFAFAFSTVLLVFVAAFSYLAYWQMERRLVFGARDALNAHLNHEINHLKIYKDHGNDHSNTLHHKNIFHRIWKNELLIKDFFPTPSAHIDWFNNEYPSDILIEKTQLYIDENNYRILAYYDLKSTFDYLDTLKRVLLIGLFVAGLLILPLSWSLSKLLLRPFRDLASATKKLNAKQLYFRFPKTFQQDEYGSLVENFNHLLSNLENAFHQIRRFSSSVSHEIRTPLTVIQGEAELMLRKNREIADYQRGFQNILAQALKLQKLTTQLLVLADVERMGLESRVSKVKIFEALQEMVDHFQRTQQYESRQIEMRVLEINFLGSSELLACILNNLIENAFKYSLAKINIRAERTENGISICIEDDGPGIPEEERGNVFRPLYRLNSASKITGYGLGLSIVKACVDAMHGQILLARSNLGGLLVALEIPDQKDITSNNETRAKTNPKSLEKHLEFVVLDTLN